MSMTSWVAALVCATLVTIALQGCERDEAKEILLEEPGSVPGSPSPAPAQAPALVHVPSPAPTLGFGRVTRSATQPTTVPYSCAKWFDGCNECDVWIYIWIDLVCTRKTCLTLAEPECLRYDCLSNGPWTPFSRSSTAWTNEKKAWCCKEKGLGCGAPLRPSTCTKWFDGCNVCGVMNGMEVGGVANGLRVCTEKSCPTLAEPECLEYDCLSREAWTNEKKAWCCKEKGLGCRAPLRPSACTKWFDGCNECGVVNGMEFCTEKDCLMLAEPECLEYNCLTREAWPSVKKEWCCKEKGLGCEEISANETETDNNTANRTK
jgi:hypothetical protein